MLPTPDASASTAFRALVAEGRPPVILQVLPALNSGGVEQGVIDINAAIVRAGGKSIVVSSGGARAHEIGKVGGLHIVLPVHSKNPFVMASTVGRLRALIREKGVDVVHACSRAPAWVCERAVKGTKARYVTSCHAAHSVAGPFKKTYNAAIARGERVIAVSHFLADYLDQHYAPDPAKVRVIHRGVAPERFHPSAVSAERLVKMARACRVPDGASVVMLPGRLSRIKGHMFVLDALEKLQRKDLFCLFVGSDAGKNRFRRELEKYIAAKRMGDVVRIMTDCKDMPAAYMLATAVVSPSLVPEGFGRVPVEAQAMGRPLIATDHGGARETVLRDETGWLVEPGNVAELSRALAEAVDLGPRDRAALAARTMSHVAQNFSNDLMCARTLDVYAELLQPAQVQAPEENAPAQKEVA